MSVFKHITSVVFLGIVLLLMMVAFYFFLDKIQSKVQLGKLLSKEGIKIAVALIMSLVVFLLGVKIYSIFIWLFQWQLYCESFSKVWKFSYLLCTIIILNSANLKQLVGWFKMNNEEKIIFWMLNGKRKMIRRIVFTIKIIKLERWFLYEYE